MNYVIMVKITQILLHLLHNIPNYSYSYMLHCGNLECDDLIKRRRVVPDRRNHHIQGQGASMPFAPPFLVYTQVTAND